MTPLLDAHAHFFLPGFVGALPENCRRRDPGEFTLYQAHAERHQIAQVLAIGYEGESWAAGNNNYLASLAAQHDWVRPLAFVSEPERLTITQLEAWQAERFVGIVFYLFSPQSASTLQRVPQEVWQWLADHAWLISVNSSGEQWTEWQPILEQHTTLRLLIAHLGLPPAVATPPTSAQARQSLAPVIALAKHPNTYVKFSALYALATPSYAYPHQAAWPYAEALYEQFGSQRILWASDFSPALESVSFPQTVEVLAAMPWLAESDRSAIYTDNLANLLATYAERNPRP